MNRKHKKTRKLIVNATLLSLIVAVLTYWVFWQQANLHNDSFTTGYVLIGCLVFLTAFQLRKKLNFLPFLGSSRFWMQLHIYVGLGTFAIFGLHIGFRIPQGGLETCLAGLYLTVAFSGVYGLFMSRTVPKKLTLIDHEVIYEQIPSMRYELARQVQSLMESTIQRSETLARFYVNRLSPFFDQPRTLAYMVCPTSYRSRQLQNEIRQLDRYLTREQRNLGEKLIQMVRSKDNLDFHRAMQGRLKYWLFLHVGLTYSLLIFSVVHGIMAHAFHGGIR